MIKLSENTELLRVVKVRINHKELQKESMTLSSSNKRAKRNSKEMKVKCSIHQKKKNLSFFISNVVLVDYFYHLESILR